MKKAIQELKNEFNAKIDYLRYQLINIEKQALNSESRRQIACSIAVILRALICHDRDDSLCKRCNYDNYFYFQLYDIWNTLNILPDYELVSITIKDNKAIFDHKKDIVRTEEVCTKWLKFHSWLNEVIIDYKIEDIPPLSRLNVIKLIADKIGAHVDSDVDPRFEILKKSLIMPITIKINKGNEEIEVEANCENLYIETIISIAQELIYAFDYTRKFYPVLIGQSKMILYIQKYNKNQPINTNINNIPTKYFICDKEKSKEINCYNSNKHYQCETIKQDLNEYQIKFRDKYFNVLIIEN